MSGVRRLPESSEARLRSVAGSLAVASLLALGCVSPLAAQFRALPAVPVVRTVPSAVDPLVLRSHDIQEPEQTVDRPLPLVGALGAAVGSLAGAFVGYHLDYNVLNLDCERGCEDPGLPGLTAGWFIGSALTTPPSVHLANHRRGSLSTEYLSSAVIAGVGMAALLALGSPEGAYIALGAPVAQVISAVLIERRTTP